MYRRFFIAQEGGVGRAEKIRLLKTAGQKRRFLIIEGYVKVC
jgi:hypothetical protein